MNAANPSEATPLPPFADGDKVLWTGKSQRLHVEAVVIGSSCVITKRKMRKNTKDVAVWTIEIEYKNTAGETKHASVLSDTLVKA